MWGEGVNDDSSSSSGALIYSLNTAALPLVVDETTGQIPRDLAGSGKLPPLLSALHLVLRHSSPAARLSGAWCVRCLCLSLPSQLSSLLDYCMARLQEAGSSPTAVTGYSFALASLLGTARHSELGLPTGKASVSHPLHQSSYYSGGVRGVCESLVVGV